MKLIKTIALVLFLGLAACAPYWDGYGYGHETINDTTVYRNQSYPGWRVMPYDHDYRYDNPGWSNHGWHGAHDSHKWNKDRH